MNPRHTGYEPVRLTTALLRSINHFRLQLMRVQGWVPPKFRFASLISTTPYLILWSEFVRSLGTVVSPHGALGLQGLEFFDQLVVEPHLI